MSLREVRGRSLFRKLIQPTLLTEQYTQSRMRECVPDIQLEMVWKITKGFCLKGLSKITKTSEVRKPQLRHEVSRPFLKPAPPRYEAGVLKKSKSKSKSKSPPSGCCVFDGDTLHSSSSLLVRSDKPRHPEHFVTD